MTAQEAIAWSEAVAAVPEGRRWRRLRVLLRDRAAVAGAVLLLLFVLASIFAPLLTPYGPNTTDFTNTLSGPGVHHWLGTDDLGRDELTRILYGGRVSIGMAVVAATLSAAIGLTLGLISGYFGGVFDLVLMRVVDGLQALPGLLLAFAVAGLLGAGLLNIEIAVIAVWWTGYARVVRSMVLSLRERAFVEAARGTGATNRMIIIRHILPNVVGPATVLATLELAHVLLALAALSFLGLGVAPPTAEWGTMLSQAKDFFDRAPQLLIYPGLAITLVALASNLMGDGLRDALDPRLQRDVTVRCVAAR
ncbi:MAG: ABC transporter permease [Candidatus Dormibacteraeota bacterium]|nr:ABC transporter permease [Candidatus Dormibacteraeota bacterium]